MKHDSKGKGGEFVMEKYTTAELQIIEFEAEDVITESYPNLD